MTVTTVRVVVADIGGVLCRFDPKPRLAALAERTGLGENELHDKIFVSGFEADCEAGHYTAAGACDWLRANVGLTGEVAEISRLWTSAFTVDPAVVSALTEQGLPLAIFSNNGPLFADYFDERFGELAALFPRRFFACRLGLRKPQPEAFEAVAAALAEEAEASADEIFFVDDNPDNTKAARQLGWRTHTFTGVGDLRAALSRW
ncbi:HAD-IA family hydrolase [Phytomonospora sp. NPDC050363]|uniref:HAD-IA family hydrolase n=1 Tax=Phytomonospora sp. NPDC050363 TaxID=3155642 RepID=UPI00340A2C26